MPGIQKRFVSPQVVNTIEESVKALRYEQVGLVSGVELVNIGVGFRTIYHLSFNCCR